MKRVSIPLPLSDEEKELFTKQAKQLEWPLSKYLRVSATAFLLQLQKSSLPFNTAYETALLMEKDGRSERKRE